MKNRTLALLFSLLVSSLAFAQTGQTPEKVKIYNPAADAKADIQAAVAQAAQDGKHVLLQIGGNWCGWCIAFTNQVNNSDTLRKAVTDQYVLYHLNYSQENMNEEVLASLGYPQRFGFPVFVILDGKGNRLHTQNSEYLESGKGYNSKRVLEFFNSWSVAAIDPKSYERKK
jgi:thioredoxin-related protein